ncbi:MAG: GEVED domain-containing protein, partial [Bacteroidia bacterium]
WYSFVANIPNPVITVQSGPGYNAAVQLLSATGTCPTLTFTSLNCVNATSTAGIETINATGLVPGQTYYVRVFHSGIGTGNANFTICVTATPPTCPTGTFTPANNAVNQSPLATLSWPASAGAAGYNVYLGTVTPPTTIVSTNQVGTTYTPPANLNQNTQYYWSIIPVNAVGSPASCSVQNFTTMFLDDASVTGLTTANVCPGTTAATVSVTLNNNGFNPIAIGAATVVLTVTGANTGTYSWTNTAALTSITNTLVNFTTVNLATAGTNNFSVQVYYTPDGNLPNNTVTGTANTVTLAGGTTTAPTGVCSAASFALNLSGQNVPSTGVTYQWQSAPAAAGPWTNIAGATTVPYTLTTGQTAATFYQCVISACATTVNSTPVQVAMNPATLCYCIPPHIAGCNASDISNVTIATTTLNNTSTCAVNAGTAYTAYPPTGNTTANLQLGSTYALSVTTTGATNAIISVWIDYNQNGIFETTEWQQVATAAVPNVATTINITIPAGALIGQTGMRVRSRFQGNVNGAGDACTTMGSGEAEDYIVNIINCPYSPTASITPTGSTTPACSPATVLLTATAIAANTSPAYQWVRNGANIAGANSATYTATQQGFYYVKITDATAPGCGTATSNTTTVNISPAPSGVTATASATAICLPAAPLTLTGTGTISSVGSLFTENWTSNSFAAQGWTFDPAQPNWTMGTQYTPTGGTAPNAFFNWTPAMTNYSVSLVSPIINATGATNITMDYLLQLNNFSSATLEEFEVAYKPTTSSTWTVLEAFNNAAGTFNVARTAQPMAVAGQNFQVRFRAYGANSFNINGWGLDNIVINGTVVPTIAWTSTPAGYTANVLNPTAFTPTAGTTSYTLTITDPQNGCSTSATANVTVGTSPASSTLAITTPKYPGCNNSVDVQVSGGNASNNFYWYTNAAHTGTPVLSGTNGTISLSPTFGTQTHWVFEVDASGNCFGSSTSAPITTVGPIPTNVPDLTGGLIASTYKSYFANAACIDGNGWTNYYYDAPIGGTDVIILSTNEGGHDFGTLATDSLLSPTAHYFVRADVVPGYGSGQGQHVTQTTTGDNIAPEYPYDPYWFIMNRSWELKHDASHTPTTPMAVRSYFSTQDFLDVQGSLTASGSATSITSANDLFFFKISPGNDVVPSHGHAGVNDTEIAVYNNTTATPSVATPLVVGIYGQPIGTWFLGSISATTQYGEMVVPTFSGGGGGAAPTSPLPVSLLEFFGRSENGVNLLNWTTSSESNNDYFEVMRSLDNAAYESIGNVKSKAINGFSSSPLVYDYTDNNPKAKTLYYRLKQVDLNGKFRYSNTIQLNMNGDYFAAMDAFPNPTAKELNIAVSAPANNKMVVEVYDIYGRILIQQNYLATGGQEVVKLNVEKLAAGTYTVRVRSKTTDFNAATNFVKINE